MKGLAIVTVIRERVEIGQRCNNFFWNQLLLELKWSNHILSVEVAG